MKITRITIALFFCLTVLLPAQSYLENELKSYRNPEELVSLSPTISFNSAVDLISKISEKVKGIKIFSLVDINTPIGVEINNMAYDKALVVLTKMAGLEFEAKADAIVIKGKAKDKYEKTEETFADLETREVKISAVFFEMNDDMSKQRGIDWKFLLSKNGMNLESTMGVEETEDQNSGGEGGQTTKAPDFSFGGTTDFNAGGFFGRATAMFRMFEEDNLGQILASPNTTVRDRQEARIQVGSDFSIKQKDFAGNVIEQFFSTGTILNVSPFVHTQDGINYILLKINAERSSFVGGVNTEVRKTTANTEVLMLDGEETIIGGLYSNEEQQIRTGVPFLKDLPWWVLGLRYVFGSDETVVRKKELIILIKAELVPTLKERLAWPDKGNPIQEEVNKYREKAKYYQFKQSPKGN